MYPFVVALVLSSLSACFYMLAMSGEPPEQTMSSQALAENFATYHAKAVEFANAHVSYSAGAIPDASLGLPSWYAKNGPWQAYMSAKRLWVYAGAMPAAPMISELQVISQSTLNLGVTDGATQHLVSPVAGDTGITYPAVIPAGVPAWTYSVN